MGDKQAKSGANSGSLRQQLSELVSQFFGVNIPVASEKGNVSIQERKDQARLLHKKLAEAKDPDWWYACFMNALPQTMDFDEAVQIADELQGEVRPS